MPAQHSRRNLGNSQRHLIHSDPAYRLEAAVTHHPITGATVELYSTWPKANHPEPHRLISLTLPEGAFERFRDVIDRVILGS